jgi:hypothetical protein
MLRALRMAQAALNTAVRFPVPSLSTDSYKIAATVDQAIAVAEKAGISDALPRPGSSGAGSAQP